MKALSHPHTVYNNILHFFKRLSLSHSFILAPIPSRSHSSPHPPPGDPFAEKYFGDLLPSTPPLFYGSLLFSVISVISFFLPSSIQKKKKKRVTEKDNVQKEIIYFFKKKKKKIER